MDFRLSSEQEMLRDGARRFVSDKLDFDARRALGRRAHDNWPAFAELGWLMLPVPEDSGGLGGRPEDIAILAEELGRGLASDRFVECAMLPARLIDLSASEMHRAALLPALASGELRIGAALYEAAQGSSLDRPETRVVRDEAGDYKLVGEKVLVAGGVEAHKLIVAVRVDDETALFAVDTSAPGVERYDYSTVDDRQMSDFRFNDVVLSDEDRLTAPGDGARVIEQAVDETIVALCAETLGCMDKAIELTADYLKIRQQFGQPLANFQALQHGVANLFIEANDARSIVYRAIASLGRNPSERRRAVAGCKVKVMKAARTVTGMAVHYHGGIGATTEYAVGHYLRRALVSEQMFGNGQYHFERYLECGCLD